MAYNPYFPATYQPVYYPQQFQQQPQQPQSVQSQNSIIWVSGLAEAQNFPVAANAAVALWEQTGKVIYLKSADSTGRPSLKIYDLVERTESLSNTQDTQEYKVTDFALKTDLDAITAAIAAVKSDMKTLKREMKKKEVEEEDE